MSTRTLGAAITLILAVCGATSLAHSNQAPQAADYAWAGSCRSCHEPVYDAWAKTKHAAALGRLSASEQGTECVGCHLTGPRTKLLDGTTVLNGGVQCEACHGAGRAHVADPSVNTLTRVPASEVCETCHSDKSPRFKGFVYAAMAQLSHKTK
jgi:nitrate/TMAO reductase-like tetraheme cytochrome c subunit